MGNRLSYKKIVCFFYSSICIANVSHSCIISVSSSFSWLYSLSCFSVGLDFAKLSSSSEILASYSAIFSSAFLSLFYNCFCSLLINFGFVFSSFISGLIFSTSCFFCSNLDFSADISLMLSFWR